MLDAILCTMETSAKQTGANFCCHGFYNTEMVVAREIDNEQII